MVIPFADLSRATAAERELLLPALSRVVERGRFILDDEVESFEREFASFAGATFGIGCASGTDAITLALSALGVGERDEVITVSMTCAPTAAGITRAGARPVFVDVDERTLTMDPAALERAIGPRTKAVMPVHLYGRPADMESIVSVARARSLLVVEDCAQAHGATIAGRPVGTFGDAAAWSFYPTKNLGALGDGGMVTTSSPDAAARARRQRVYGYASRHDAQEPGWNSRLDELQAAVLRARLPRLLEGNRRRAALAARYDAQLHAGTGVLPPTPRPGDAPCHHLYVVRLPERDAIRARLAERGIGTGIHYPRAVHQQPAFAACRRGPLEVTERAVREVLSLPLFPELTDGEADQVAHSLLAVLAGC